MVYPLNYKEGVYSFCEYYPSNNDGWEKKIAIHLKNENNKVFDGGGGVFAFDDGVFPVVVDGCENITLRNFSIDYRHAQHAEGNIVYSAEDGFICQPLRGFFMSIADGKLAVSAGGEQRVLDRIFGQVFDVVTKAPYKNQGSVSISFVPFGAQKKDDSGRVYAYLEQCSEGIFFHLKKEDAQNLAIPVGGRLTFKLYPRTEDVIFITNCKNIRLENIHIYRSPAMGVIAQASENILLKNVNVGVKEGRSDLLSAVADATHFVNCKGRISMENCSFYNMMDDACNIHGIYAKVVEVGQKSVKVRLMHAQQKGVLFVGKGDVVQFLSPEDCKEKLQLKASAAVLCEDKTCIILSFQEDLTNVNVGDVVDNISAMPEVYIDHCRCGNNRPRGFLLTSGKKMEVKNCLFENSRSAIHVSSDMEQWYESGIVRELSIHDNHFKNCNYATGAAAITIYSPAKNGVCTHSNIRVWNNLVELDNAGFMDLYAVENVCVEGNTIRQRSGEKKSVEGVAVILATDCKNVKIEKNIGLLKEQVSLL